MISAFPASEYGLIQIHQYSKLYLGYPINASPNDQFVAKRQSWIIWTVCQEPDD
jgi:hypothetical protein